MGAAGLSDAVLRFTSQSLALGRRELAVAYIRRTARLGVFSTLIAAGVTAGALFTFHATSDRLSQPGLLVLLTVLTLSALAWQQWASETLRGCNNLRLASLFSGGAAGGPVSTLLFLIGIGVLSLSKFSLSASSVMGLLAASVCTTVPFALWCVWRTIRDIDAEPAETAVGLTSAESKQLLSMAGAVLAINLLAFVGEQLDIWIGKAFLAPDEFGVYGVAKRTILLTSMPVQMAMLTVMGAIPRLHAQKRYRDLENLMRGSAGLAAVPSLIALTLLVIFPEPILRLLFGGSYSGAAPMIRVLAIGQAMLIFVGNPSNVLYLTGQHRTALMINVVTALAVAIGGPWASIHFGVMGLTAVSAAALTLQSSLQWVFARWQSGVWTHIGLLKPQIGDESEHKSDVALSETFERRTANGLDIAPSRPVLRSEVPSQLEPI